MPKYKNDTSPVCDEFRRLDNGGAVDCWLKKGHEGDHNFDRSQMPKSPTRIEELEAQLSKSNKRAEEAERKIGVAVKFIAAMRPFTYCCIGDWENPNEHAPDCRIANELAILRPSQPSQEVK